MSEEPKIVASIEINTDNKYVLLTDRPCTCAEIETFNTRVREWLQSNNPILLAWGVKLEKVSE